MPPKEDTPSKNTDPPKGSVQDTPKDALRKLEGKEERYKEARAEIGSMSMSKTTMNQLSSSGNATKAKRDK